MTVFRLQSAADTRPRACLAEGEILPANPRSFGGIGVIAVREMARFYRYALLAKNSPTIPPSPSPTRDARSPRPGDARRGGRFV